MHAIETEPVEQAPQVAGERRHRPIAVVGLDLGAAAAAVVGPDDAIALGETVGEPAPGLDRARQAADEHHRLAGALRLVPGADRAGSCDSSR